MMKLKTTSFTERLIVGIKMLQKCSSLKWGSADIIRQIDEARRSITTAFYQKYNLGIQQYLDGEWQNARELLQEASKIYQGDGPTRQLLLYMKSKNYEAPKNWKETYHEMSDF